ncbi:unnamed protein product [Trichobilharzia szidati]|nr:unnamed protein product [Trichobilharzia szidati]
MFSLPPFKILSKCTITKMMSLSQWSLLKHPKECCEKSIDSNTPNSKNATVSLLGASVLPNRTSLSNWFIIPSTIVDKIHPTRVYQLLFCEIWQLELFVSKIGLVAGFGYLSVAEGIWGTADRNVDTIVKVKEVVPRLFYFVNQFPEDMRGTWNENVKNFFAWANSSHCSNCNLKKYFSSFGLFGKKS